MVFRIFCYPPGVVRTAHCRATMNGPTSNPSIAVCPDWARLVAVCVCVCEGGDCMCMCMCPGCIQGLGSHLVLAGAQLHIQVWGWANEQR